MKNGRRNNNNPDAKRRTVTTNSVGQAIDNGGRIRGDERIEPSITGEIDSKRNDSESNVTGSSESTIATKRNTLPTGYYYNPDGELSRIPEGHYIKDGKLRKRRTSGSNGSNASDGDSHRNRSETGDEHTRILENASIWEKPRKVGRRSKKKELTESQQRLTVVALLATGCTAIFTSVKLLTKHEHWELEELEAKILSEALNDAFETLPSKAYEIIIAIIEKWVPWVNLVFVVSAILLPRIEESAKRFEKSHYVESGASYGRNEGTKDNPFTNETVNAVT